MKDNKKRFEMLNRVLAEAKKIEEVHGKRFLNKNGFALFLCGAAIISNDPVFQIAVMRGYNLSELEKEISHLEKDLCEPKGACMFKVTQICDGRKEGSDIELNQVYTGERLGKQVYYTDKANVEWVFYIGDTCELVQVNNKNQ